MGATELGRIAPLTSHARTHAERTHLAETRWLKVQPDEASETACECRAVLLLVCGLGLASACGLLGCRTYENEGK